MPGFTGAASIAARVEAARRIGSLAGLLPGASAEDIKASTFYNRRGEVAAHIDGNGFMTEFVHDANGRVVKTIAYARFIVQPIPPGPSLAALRPASSAEDQVTTSRYDAFGRLITQTNAEGTVTTFSYDAVGQLN